jgi:hypothetical protein
MVVLRENTQIHPNPLEKALKDVLVHEKPYVCYYEVPFYMGPPPPPSRWRCPDFLIPQLKVDGKAVILDPHHFKGSVDHYESKRERKENEKDVKKWIDFKNKYGKLVHIELVSFNTPEEIEYQTGCGYDAFCDEVWHVRNRDPSIIKQSARALLKKMEDKSDDIEYWTAPEMELNKLLRRNC